MLIDWFTVGAQTLNFLILVWLMKRFLYQPILHAIDAREERIAAELADADAKKSEAQQERDEFQHKNAEFDKQRAALLSQATDEVKTERQRLLDEAQKDADMLSARRRDELEAEQQSLSNEISRRTQQEVFALTRQTLQDLAAVNLEERMCDVFIQHLRALNGEVKKELVASIQTTKQSSRVCSAFELSPEQRSAIQTTLNETLAADVQIQFETVPDLISGIELSVNGKKMAWSVNDYLKTVEAGAKQ
jgi:F-type H+-transporting ATPase subunit b